MNSLEEKLNNLMSKLEDKSDNKSDGGNISTTNLEQKVDKLMTHLGVKWALSSNQK